MTEMNDIVKLAVDAYHGKVQNYSTEQSMEVLHQAMIDANGGSTVLDLRKVRDGECGKLFTLVETILSRTVVEALTEDDFFMNLVEFRNVALGDRNEFVVEDYDLFVVSEAADGTQGIRRQRLGGQTKTAIPTSLKTVKIYEELNRVLSGAVDFNHFINKVAESMKQKLLNDIYTLWVGATAEQFGGATFFPAAGNYDEDELLDLVAHVEAASGGKTAYIIGTKKALRNAKESIQCDGAKEELHRFGYYGQFYGTPCVSIPQRHKVGTTEFVMDDDILTIIAGESKPIKCVREGNPIVLMDNPMNNADLTQNYFYAEAYGLGIVLAGNNQGIGRYEISGT